MTGLPVSIPTLLLVASLLAPLGACGSGVETSVTPGDSGIPEGYPHTILESDEHRTSIEAQWQRLYEQYGVAGAAGKVPDLNPFTHTPRSLLGVGALRLATGATDAPLSEETIRRLLRDFVSNNSQLLGVALNRLSLRDVRDTGAIGKRYTFVQAGFAYPVAEPWGRLEFVVNDRAEIVQIEDTAIPFTELPATARISREDAVAKVVGRTFTYSDIRGQEQQETISDPAAVTARRLVVYPEQTDAALRIRLAWEIEAGTGLSWTVYVDAITGEVVATRQNFQT